ncbi:MAG: translation initiation factor Sui1 [Candidatus Handelsmanbacteria bacterium]|nr:translation initiation factor Sui1 [Candidatus Handelsmanbacteria bacterium]
MDRPGGGRAAVNNARPVYSSDQGRLCPECGRPQAQCQCGKKPALPKGSGQVRVGRQTQGRKGKGVTVITGLPLAEEALLDLARQLKQRCGTGGTVKDGVIEIQGDHRDALVEELTRRGFAAKRSGG